MHIKLSETLPFVIKIIHIHFSFKNIFIIKILLLNVKYYHLEKKIKLKSSLYVYHPLTPSP